MALNTSIRFLVLDRTNNPVVPAHHGMSLPDLQGDKSPSFTKKETAIAFAKLLAKRNKGQRYYVSQVIGGCVAYTPMGDDQTEGVDWADATAGDE